MLRIVLTGVALLIATGAASGAMAQGRGRNSAAPRAGGGSSEDTLPPSVPPPVSTLAPTRGITGPRLQQGAVLCRTEVDLQRRAEVTRRRIEGEPDAGNPLEGCHFVTQERGVEIVGTRGLGRTQVKVKPSGEVAWTDAYVR